MDLFKQMQQEGMIPNKFTFIPVLNACASLQALEEGRWIHTQNLGGLDFPIIHASNLPKPHHCASFLYPSLHLNFCFS
jgi:hypothetical protein